MTNKTADNIMQFPSISRYKADNAHILLNGYNAPMSLGGWADNVRAKAAAYVSEFGVPTTKLERFKYSNLSAFLHNLDLQSGAARIALEGAVAYAQPLETILQNPPEWAKLLLTAAPAGEDKYQDMMLWHGANAFLRDGVIVDIPADESVDNPLVINVTGRSGLYFTHRSIIRLAPHSAATVIEYHTGEGAYWNNSVTQIILGDGARLRHYRVQGGAPESAYTHNTHVQVAANAEYEAFTLTQGGGFSRHQVHVELLGAQAVCHLNGINLLRDSQLGDTTITIEHKAPHCNSNQNYRSVLADQAVGVFQGKVHVHKIAQKTDGYQMSNALILSEGAQMNTKPELEIYADDVKCSHGALTGQLDETPLFYLRSRGIPEAEVRKLLIHAFIGELVDTVRDTVFKDCLIYNIEKWLQDVEKS